MEFSTPKSCPKPVVSIVMLVYNSSATIGESIDSVLHQTFTDWELIIIDDCSEENIEEKSGAIQIKEYATTGLPKIMALHMPEMWQSKKREAGILRSWIVMICGSRKNWNARFSLWRRIIIRLPILGIDSLKKVHKSRGG